MMLHIQEEVELNREKSSAKRKGKAAARQKENPAPAASGSATSEARPEDSSNLAVQPSLHKLQQDLDLKKAERDRKMAELKMMDEECLAAEAELHRQANGGLLRASPGLHTMGAAPTAGAAAGGQTGTPTAAPAKDPAGQPELDPEGKPPDSIPPGKRFSYLSRDQRPELVKPAERCSCEFLLRERTRPALL